MANLDVLVSHGPIYFWLQAKLTRAIACWDRDPSDEVVARLVQHPQAEKMALAQTLAENLHGRERAWNPAP